MPDPRYSHPLYVDAERVTINLPRTMRTELQQLAFADGRSLSNQIVWALSEWLESRAISLRRAPERSRP